jgi:mannose-6-phosphate isomerase-like protein (cupin superfamily)
MNGGRDPTPNHEETAVRDVTLKRFDEMDSGLAGMFVRVRAELGVSSFGLQVINLPAHCDRYPEHAHAGPDSGAVNHGQEEVYVPLSGRATLIAGGQRWELAPGMAVRVGPAEKRQVVTDQDTFQMLALGATPNEIYETIPFSEVGAGDRPPAR